MDEARQVLERLERIEALDRSRGSAADLLDELRALVRDAECWLRAEAEPRGAVDALVRCRSAVESFDGEVVPLAE